MTTDRIAQLEREKWIDNITGMLCNIGAIEHDSIPEVVHALRDAMTFADQQVQREREICHEL